MTTWTFFLVYQISFADTMWLRSLKDFTVRKWVILKSIKSYTPKKRKKVLFLRSMNFVSDSVIVFTSFISTTMKKLSVCHLRVVAVGQFVILGSIKKKKWSKWLKLILIWMVKIFYIPPPPKKKTKLDINLWVGYSGQPDFILILYSIWY